MKKLIIISIIPLFSFQCEKGWLNEILDPILEGCNIPTACNYNPDVNKFDNSCEYISCLDCLGYQHGIAVLDSCGTCDASTLNDCTQDCADTWGGTAVVNACGNCGDIDCELDCSGVWGGSTLVDVCGVCGGDGSTCNDCNGDTNGTAYTDGCENCVGGNTGQTACTTENDCTGVEGGTSYIDNCGTCDADSENDCVQDCAGTWGGSIVLDSCGVCDGDNFDCTDCLGEVGGSATTDDCGICDTDSTNDCTQDCDGVWGGSALIDNCGVCGGDNSDCMDCLGEVGGTATTDCEGVCNGSATTDDCGTCDTDSTNDCTQDCDGVWGGSASLDECDICEGENICEAYTLEKLSTNPPYSVFDDYEINADGTLLTPIEWNFPEVSSETEGNISEFIIRSDWHSKRPKDLEILFNNEVICSWTHPYSNTGCYTSVEEFINNGSNTPCAVDIDSYSSCKFDDEIAFDDAQNLTLRILSVYSLIIVFRDTWVSSGCQVVSGPDVNCGNLCNGTYDYCSTDLNVLQQFIDNSSETINMEMDDNGDGIIEPLELGEQVWENGRLNEFNCRLLYFSSWTNCGLSGVIPPEIGNLINLTYLDLGDNQLTGEIPSEIGNLTNLTFLDLVNKLTGEIPVAIGNLTKLTHLSLSANQLTGVIPSEIGNLTNLTLLYLYANQLTGDIPPEVCDLIESNNLDMNEILNGNNLINTCD